MADRDDRKPRVEVERGEKDPRPQVESGDGATQAAASDAAPGAEAAAEGAPKADDAPHASAGDALRDAGGRVRSWVHATFPGNENAFWGGVAGLLAALVLIAIGPWLTILIAVLILAGVAVGQIADGDPKIINALRRLFSRSNQ